MTGPPKTAIVTGASQGIGAGIVKGFAERGFNVVANSRKMTQSTEVAASDQVALVDGHIGEPATAAKIVETALSRFKSMDALVNNAGIFFTKPFTEYTAEDFNSLVSTILAAVVGSPMWPSTRATWSEAATSVDWVIFRELATTLKPRSRNPFTIPAPIPCEAPVTMAVFRGPLMVAQLENVLALQKSASSTMR